MKTENEPDLLKQELVNVIVVLTEFIQDICL